MPDRHPPARTRPGRGRATADPAAPGRYRIGSGNLDLIVDRHDSRGRIVILNGIPNSYVHLDDPTRLEYEYVRWIGDLIDVVAAPEDPVSVAHLGGAGCTLPRYVSATRPGSRQVVFEYDPSLIEFAREAFDLRADSRLKLRAGDGRDGITTLRDGVYDLVIRDAFAGDRVPEHMTTVEFHTEVTRVLKPDGLSVANVADRTTTTEARSEAATMLAVFAHVMVIAEPAQLRGRRYGNVIVVGSRQPLPVKAMTRRLASGAVRASLLATQRTAELAAGHHPRQDADYATTADITPGEGDPQASSPGGAPRSSKGAPPPAPPSS